MRVLFEQLHAASGQPFVEGVLDETPYARTLGLRFQAFHGALVLVMPFKPALVGTKRINRIHGGVIAGLLDAAAWVAVAQALHAEGRDEDSAPRPVTVTVEYLREGKPQETYAAGQVTRLGRRIANVRADAWQADRTRPIATAHLNFMLER